MNRRISRIQDRINSLSNRIQKETAGKGLKKMAKQGEGNKDTSGTGSSKSIIQSPRNDAPRSKTLGYRAAFVNSDGSFTVLQIGKPAGLGAPDPAAPVWTAEGIQAVQVFLGRDINVKVNDPVNVVDGAILDISGNVIVKALPNVVLSDSIGLFQSGETIYETDNSGKVTGRFNSVNEDTIIHFNKEIIIDGQGRAKQEEDKRNPSSNINQLKDIKQK